MHVLVSVCICLLNTLFYRTIHVIHRFCYMTPFKGSCETPEQKVEPGVITVSAKRSGYDVKQTPASCKIAPFLKSSSAAGG